MDTPSNPESFYINLKDKLYDTASWPSEYLYKFIIKSNPSKVNKIETIFDNIGAVIKKNSFKKRHLFEPFGECGYEKPRGCD